RVVRLRATNQRPLTNRDAQGLQRHYPPDPLVAADSLRRMIQLSPETALPRDCEGELVAPNDLDDPSRGYQRWRFTTYGDFRMGELTCADKPYCPRGPLQVKFSTPVRGNDVLRYVKLVPDAKITIRDTAAVQTEWWLEAKLEPRTGYALVVD